MKLYGGCVDWKSSTQEWTSTSSCEAEYRALSAASKAALAYMPILDAYGIPSQPLPILTDSEAAWKAVRAWNLTPNIKHIETHHNFMRERHAAGHLNYQHIPGTLNTADILTKPLGIKLLQQHRAGLGVLPVPA